MSLSLSDILFGIGVFALLALGWESAPRAELAIQSPLPAITLAQVEERYVSGRRCEVGGTMLNSGSAPLAAAEFRLVVDGPDGTIVAGAMPVEHLAIGDRRPFALQYNCDDGIGRWFYRVYAGRIPLPVRR